jgi:hypothetical protein
MQGISINDTVEAGIFFRTVINPSCAMKTLICWSWSGIFILIRFGPKLLKIMTSKKISLLRALRLDREASKKLAANQFGVKIV